MASVEGFQRRDSVLVQFTRDPALYHWRQVVSCVTAGSEEGVGRRLVVCSTPDRDVQEINLDEEGRFRAILRWALGDRIPTGVDELI